VPFHVQIYDSTGQNFHGIYAWDLSEDELERRILLPYREGRPIVTGGQTVDVATITKIRIRETEQEARHYRQAAESKRTPGTVTSPNLLLFGMGADRTDHFITGPAGSDAPAKDPGPGPDAAVVLLGLCERIPRVVRQLASRDRKRTPLTIDDEYDLQYLVRALLALSFDDVRAEEWTPSYAGGSTKMDFLVKREKVVLELKRTRDGLDDREVGNQLIEDIAHYGAHPDCERLICFVYDHDHRISNPDGLVHDLTSNPPGGLDVNVVIEPR
jgi:hypothetical protein